MMDGQAEKEAGTQPGAEATAAAADAAIDPGTIEFRVVSSDGVRHSLKLERIFWSLLEAAAGAERERLGAYIGRVTAAAANKGSKSSGLRAHAAVWLRRQLADMSARSLARKSLRGIVLAAPTPCFVVTAQNAIETQNEAFLDLLSGFSATAAGDRTQPIRIAFRTDFQSLRDKARAQAMSYVTDQVIIHVGDRRSQHQARIAVIDSAGGQPMALLVHLVD